MPAKKSSDFDESVTSSLSHSLTKKKEDDSYSDSFEESSMTNSNSKQSMSLIKKQNQISSSGGYSESSASKGNKFGKANTTVANKGTESSSDRYDDDEFESMSMSKSKGDFAAK